jgi:hypothetical protein
MITVERIALRPVEREVVIRLSTEEAGELDKFLYSHTRCMMSEVERQHHVAFKLHAALQSRFNTPPTLVDEMDE